MCVRMATGMRIFRIINERDPQPISSAALADASGASKSMIAQNPTAGENFQTYMRSFQIRSPPWVDTFPVQEQIINFFQQTHADKATDAVLLVDVAGGRGQDIIHFRQKFQHVPGRLVLQDKSIAPATSKGSLDGIEVQTYDFFTPQPIQGESQSTRYSSIRARAYTFHHIFSDWSDDASAKILSKTVAAMTPGYSKLLLHELILPSENCSWQDAALDIIVMTSFSGQHRSENEWRSLLASIGLQNITFWYPPGLGNGIIEAVRGDPDTVESDARTRNPTYHTREGDYALPNDSIEYDRLSDQALGLSELMHNNFIHAPLRSPSLLIDIGCGTGTVTCQLGSTYPAAQIYGIDLSPVPAHQKPSNVEYIQGDIRTLLDTDPRRLPPGTADFVFSRLLILGMTDWAGYIRGAASLLKPGGWLEVQDYNMDYYLLGEHCSSSWGWVGALEAAAEKKGWDLRCGTNAKKYMQDAGLVDVQTKRYAVPFGTWNAGNAPETRRMGAHAAREYGVMYWHAIPKMVAGLGFTDEQVQAWKWEAKRTLAQEVGKEIYFYVTVGRKV
ncbi:MAG: hypothetical protein Q9191_007240 [Dirinaria sp. TL-2023a]